MLVGLDVRAAGFFANGAPAKSDLLLAGVHLDDLEVELLSGFKLQRSAVLIVGFGVVAETLDSIRDLDEGPEGRNTKHLAVHNVANAVRLEEALPDIGLELLHAQREATVVGLDRQDH